MNANRFVYNVKVYEHDWFIAVRDLSTRKGVLYHNSPNLEGMLSAFSKDGVYGGFGSKAYDRYIVKAVCGGFSPEQVFALHKHIKSGGAAWKFPGLSSIKWDLVNTDLSDDSKSSLNVTAIAGHLGADIPDYPVPDDINRPLTDDEIKAVSSALIQENKVLAEIMDIRLPYLDVKESISNMANLGLKGLGMTNAKLCSILMGAKKRTYNDARDYVYPSNIRREYIPNEMFDFINKLYDKSLSDRDVFTGRKLNLNIGNCEIVIANGGIHGAIPGYDSNSLPEGRVMIILDATGFYPSVIINNGYTSRSVDDPSIYSGVVNTRKEAKAAGNKKVSDPLKTVVNTYFGSMLSPYNDLYDPLMGRSTIYTGQLYLVELLNHLSKDIDGLKVVMGNTDGFTIECNESDIPAVFAIVEEWQNRTGLTLEQDTDVSRVIQKNVNNYIEVKNDGSVKIKGELSRGVEQTTGFKVNNNASIISDAVVAYALHGTPIEKTIQDCTDIHKFQYITGSGNALSCFTTVGGVRKDLPLICRVYASRDVNADTVYAVTLDKRNAVSTSKIKDIPEHCIVDNHNTISVKDIDLNYYISAACKLAESYVNHEVPVTYVSYDRFTNISDAEIDIDDISFDSLEPSPVKFSSEEQMEKVAESYSSGVISEKDYNEQISTIMHEFVSQVSEAYMDKPMPDSVASSLLFTQRRFLPTWISESMIENGGSAPLYDINGTKVCSDFSKVLITPLGSYIEFPRDSICMDNIKVFPGEEYRLSPAAAGNQSSYIYTTKSDSGCRIGLRVKDDSLYGLKKDYCYISVNEVVDASLYREFSDDPIVNKGLDAYGSASLMDEMNNEENAEPEPSTLAESLKDDYCVFEEETDGISYLYQCHIYEDPDNGPYLNIMRIPYDDAVEIFKGCNGNIDMAEDKIFMSAKHFDIPSADKGFSAQLSHIQGVIDDNPVSKVPSGKLSSTLESIMGEARGEVYGVL